MLPLKPPASKMCMKNIKHINFPIFDDNGKILDINTWPSYNGIFNGKDIIIKDTNDISRLSYMGSFGKFGKFDKNNCIEYKTLENQKLRQKKNWQNMDLVPFEFSRNIEDTETSRGSVLAEAELVKMKFENSQKPTSDTVQDAPTNWSDLKKNYNKEFDELLTLSGQVHKLPYFLLFEEAFFLSYTLECLKIKSENGSVISILECWKQFNGLKKDFPHFYAVYHFYRSKGWVVKSGHQYGGAYVLYKSLPTYYHSSYVVMISINGENSKSLSSWPSWFGSCRAIEAANKDLLVCTVHGPKYEEEMPIDLTKYTVNETIIRRWVPSQNRVKP